MNLGSAFPKVGGRFARPDTAPCKSWRPASLPHCCPACNTAHWQTQYGDATEPPGCLRAALPPAPTGRFHEPDPHIRTAPGLTLRPSCNLCLLERLHRRHLLPAGAAGNEPSPGCPRSGLPVLPSRMQLQAGRRTLVEKTASDTANAGVTGNPESLNGQQRTGCGPDRAEALLSSPQRPPVLPSIGHGTAPLPPT